MDAAVAFYEGLFGWRADEAGDPEETGGYRMFRKDDKVVAGVGPLQAEGQPTVWTTYVASDDADETARKAEAAGGTVMVAPFDVLDAGRMSIIVDATGAVFGVWQPKRHPGAELFNEHGSLTWNELATRDPEGATRFYADVFGWEPRTREILGVPYTWFFNGRRGIAGMRQMTDEWPQGIQPHWMPYFQVDDADAAAARATELGGGVGVPVTDIPPGRFAVLFDGPRAHFSILEPNEEARRVARTPEGVPV